MDLQATAVFERNYDSKARIVVNQGGTGSSKTWSLAQLFATRMRERTGRKLTIARKAMPTLKATAMADFFSIVKQLGMYSEDRHNKTDYTFAYNNNLLEFLAVDDEQKMRSRKRHDLWINEGNELTYDEFRQLVMRTSGQVYIDFNPSDQFHWIYDHVISRDDCELIISTYRDNTFLEPEKVKEIERYKETDENYWKIYGLGERGTSETTIYTRVHFIDELPEGGETIYGLDFGFNHPAALVEIKMKDDDIYAKELLYKTHLDDNELIAELKALKLKGSYIYCDSSEPGSIQMLQKAGFAAVKSNKDVADGIKSIKKRKFHVTKDSPNLWKETKSYRYMQKGDQVLDDPVKLNDDLLDAARYAVHTHTNQPKPGFYLG
ncbi:hypothetical protein LCGC14_0418180 [marine sediment metagenome]|uniref:Phage terminase large subunit N-terminal domain-containing protein n=1 Tax=marine sediment metagenome TaxID=412755 RepID=A0A0F9T9W6_9ZZZZ